MQFRWNLGKFGWNLAGIRHNFGGIWADLMNLVTFRWNTGKLRLIPPKSPPFPPFQVYKRKTEAAKKEYLKALAAYRAILVRPMGMGFGLNSAGFGGCVAIMDVSQARVHFGVNSS